MIDDSFESAIPAAYLDLVLEVAASHGIDPTSSADLEHYFAKTLELLTEAGPDLHQRLVFQIKRDFRSVGTDPRWIQNPNWQVAGGRPMVFVGQVDVPASAGLFHDDAAFYVFWGPATGEVRGVVQVA